MSRLIFLIHMKYSKHRNSKNLKDKTFVGTVQGNERGFVFILPEIDAGHDFFVPKKAVNGAYHGDKVLAAHVRGTKDEAYIIKIIERANPQIVGTLQRDRRCAYVYPDNVKQPTVFIPLSSVFNAKNGDKVVCEITSYPKGKAPGGKIIEILGEEGDLLTEEISIIRSYNLEEEFPRNIIDEARAAASEAVKTDGREDLTEKVIITIDGEDTRDIDDGVSLEIKDGNYILGVHIADVSHYVKFGSALDNDAYSRGTSVYFPDRVLPMLPKELSNGACSLNEGEKRYAISCIMTFAPDGERLSCDIKKSVIRSAYRMTYTDVTAICSGDEKTCKKYASIKDMCIAMEKLCLILEQKRERLGCINLDVKEAHIYVDENGKIVIPSARRTISQRIIEQFMIAANEAVAEYLQKHGAPCLYRIHEQPSLEKAGTFFSFLRDLGIKAQGTPDDLKPRDFQAILQKTEDKPFYSVINKVMLRSMQKARYCEENRGHFGLASECYCHFTSPIRRYPDLFVHRVIKLVLKGCGETAKKLYGKIVHDAGIDTSARERTAEECERKVDDLYKLAYMSERLGEEYDAVISGVTAFGIFCELENSVEGLVPIEDLPADGYEFYEEKFLLKGTKHSYKIGQKVKIKVADCDLARLRVLFKLL
ncbi:MAG: ribonuclease R [Clostridia bacterium]|nr:ribonuclease R [Clostridia bacterium]